MSLRRRTLIVFSATYCVLILVINAALMHGLSARFGRLEAQQAQEQANLVVSDLLDEAGELGEITRQSACRDGLYALVTQPGQRAFEAWTTGAVIGHQPTIAVVLDNAGRVVHASIRGPKGEHTAAMPPGLRDAIPALRKQLTSRPSSRGTYGLLGLGSAPALIACHVIPKPDGRGPARGLLIMGRYVDGSFQSTVQTTTGAQVALFTKGLDNTPADVTAVRSELQPGEPLVRPLDEGKTAAYLAISDLTGSSTLIARVVLPRLYYGQAQRELRGLIISVLAIGLAYGLLAVCGLERWLLSRLAALTVQVQRIGQAGDLQARLPLASGNDELSRLGANINSMLASLASAQAQRLQTEQRQTAILDQAHEGIALVDTSTHQIAQANAALEALLGLRTGELVGRDLDQILPGHDAWDSVGELAASGGHREIEVQAVRGDGTRLDMVMSFSVLQEGERGVLCAMFRDVSEQRRAEEDRQRFQEGLRQSQKLQALGQLAAGLAHNFNNVLAVVTGAVELAMLQCDGATRQHLQMVLSASERAAGMVRQFMLFSRRTPIERRPMDLSKLVEDVADMCRRTFDRKIVLEVREMGHLPLVLGDQSQIHGVLLNICLNARDAWQGSDAEGRPLRIELAAHAMAVGAGSSLHQLEPGEYVHLTIADNGPGMPDAVRDRIFEPFFTTKEVGKGTGLGLSTAYGVITELGGLINCETRVGAGSVFHVYLPAATAAELREAATDDDPARDLGRGETILFVDDEDPLRIIVRGMLERNGYRVMLAENGREGLSVFAQHFESIDLVLLDLSMPRMSGWELLNAIRVMQPGVKAVVCSGYPMAEGELKGAQAAVAKPFVCSELLRVLRRVIDEALVPAPCPLPAEASEATAELAAVIEEASSPE